MMVQSEDNILNYLDRLYWKSSINMFDHTTELQIHFDLNPDEANQYVCTWLRKFGQRFLESQVLDGKLLVLA